MPLAEPLLGATPAPPCRDAPMSTTLTARTILAEGGGVEDANDLRAPTGILIGVALSCALWAGIVAVIAALI